MWFIRSTETRRHGIRCRQNTTDDVDDTAETRWVDAELVTPARTHFALTPVWFIRSTETLRHEIRCGQTTTDDADAAADAQRADPEPAAPTRTCCVLAPPRGDAGTALPPHLLADLRRVRLPLSCHAFAHLLPYIPHVGQTISALFISFPALYL